MLYWVYLYTIFENKTIYNKLIQMLILILNFRDLHIYIAEDFENVQLQELKKINISTYFIIIV